MTPTPSAHFVKGVEVNLKYWSQLVEQYPEKLIFEHPNLLSAVQFGLALPQTQTLAVDLTLKSLALLENLGVWHVWFAILEIILSRDSDNQTALRIKALNWLGRWFRLNWQLQKAISIHQEAEVTANQTNDKQALAETYLYLSEDYLRLHQYETAQKYGKLAFAEWEHLPESEKFKAATLNTLGLIHLERGEFIEAEKRFGEAAVLWESLGRFTQLARALKNLGFTLYRQNRLEDASAAYGDALNWLDRTNSQLDKIEVQNNLGILYFEWGQLERAEVVFKQARESLRQLPGRYSISASLVQNLGTVLLKQKKFFDAESILRQSMFLWQQLNNNLELANTLGSMGTALAGQEKKEKAREYYLEALHLLSNYPDNSWAKKLQKEVEEGLDFLD